MSAGPSGIPKSYRPAAIALLLLRLRTSNCIRGLVPPAGPTYLISHSKCRTVFRSRLAPVVEPRGGDVGMT
jgi:hypothetical protein